MATTTRINLGVQNSNTATLPKVNSVNEQFKATKIWNEILQSFYLGIELTKHKRNMKTYYDCFAASQAVNWLKNYLRECEHFKDRKVTRFQALNLLRKYHKSSIIERVKADKNNKELQDNNELYRFSVNANENLPFLSASKSDVDLIESCQTEPNQVVELNLNEIIAAYKSVVWEQIRSLQPNITDFIKLDKIDGTSLYNNITRINANGVVQLTDKAQDLPHWIMSAMKCLAIWPKASGNGNCLPKYPGFEGDIFNLIRDYFSNLEEPIIPFEFYKLLMNTFDSYLQESAFKQNRKLPSFLKCNSALLRETVSQSEIRNDLNLPSNCVYETAFSSREPVTKIVSIDELSVVFPNLVNYFQPMNGRQNLTTTFSPMNSMAMCSTFKAISTMPRSASKLRAQSVNASTPQNTKNSQMMSDILCLDSPPESGEYMLNKDMTQQKRFYSLHRNESRKTNSTLMAPSTLNKQFQLLQLLLFTLPSSNRRHLQLLLRLFYKIIRNKDLCLLTKDSLALKEHIVNTFSRSILRCHDEIDYNELTGKEFVSFLIDECMDLFRLPEEVTTEIEKTINNLKTKKAGMSGNFCQKISSDEFELQRDVLSENALSELLESIMRDDSMSERDKLKWIKQFKMYHPDVYDIYFTNCSAKTSSTSERAPSRTSTARTRSLGSTILPNSKFIKRFLSLRF